MAKKSASSRPAGALPLSGLFRAFRGGRWAALVLLIAALLAGLWLTVWDHVREHVLSNSQYRLDAKDIAITPPPPWIHTDIKAQVIRDANLESSLSILDKDLTLRLAQAFGLHPWVAKVMRASKQPRVEVELIYRQPAAMVEVGGGLLPVDAEGVLLPSEDFTPAEAKTYPRLTDISTSPVGSPGTAWGDGRVTGASQIAAVLGTHWQEMKLDHILPSPSRVGVRTSADIVYEVYTRSGTRILWGHAPAAEVSGEMRTAAKITELIKRLRQDGSLDADSGDIDLMNSGGPLASPRPAIKPLPLLEEREE
jgi:hypothetical protein